MPTGGPNLLGMSLREAIFTAQRQGWRITTTGSGYVTRQVEQHDPATGELVYALTLSPISEKQP
jgi:hypothetical protein